MVVQTRLRRIVGPLVFHAVAAATSAWFVWHAVNGQRGLKTNQDYERQIADLQGDIDRLATERADWTRRIALLRGDTVDRDMLDEQARLQLGRLNKYDVVIPLPERPAR